MPSCKPSLGVALLKDGALEGLVVRPSSAACESRWGRFGVEHLGDGNHRCRKGPVQLKRRRPPRQMPSKVLGIERCASIIALSTAARAALQSTNA